MRASRQREHGFTYIGLLMFVVVIGLMLTVAARVWSTTEQRERETQLLFAGHAYRMAIASYYASGHQYPQTLEQLLTDDRSPVPLRHLRRLYPDPMTGSVDWTLIPTPSGTGIMGVASTSQRAPIKQKRFEAIDSSFIDADCYCKWRFIYYPNRFNRFLPSRGGLQPGSPTSPTPPANPASSTDLTPPANPPSPTDPAAPTP